MTATATFLETFFCKELLGHDISLCLPKSVADGFLMDNNTQRGHYQKPHVPINLTFGSAAILCRSIPFVSGPSRPRSIRRGPAALRPGLSTGLPFSNQ